MHRYLHAFGVLPTDRFVECNGLELKGQYTGQTAPTVKRMVSEAMGGCLFIDEVRPSELLSHASPNYHLVLSLTNSLLPTSCTPTAGLRAD
jgi:hypothetical protein